MLPVRFRHLGVAVPSLDEAIPAYRLFGYSLVAGPFDDGLQRVAVCFLKSAEPGAPVLVLVAPAATDSPIARMLAHGIGAYHVCYETDDLNRVLGTARLHGCVMIGAPVPAAAFGGRRTAWLFTRTKQLVELVER
jgi:methylmalonyl-CoA/ethylmalonyl-CoA epimerase